VGTTDASSDAATIRLLVLGRLELLVGGEPHPLPQGQPSGALLAWLALHPGVHERDEVAEQLWPGGLRKARRDSLKTALAKVRRALPAAVLDGSLTVTRNELGFAPDRVSTDLDDFGTLVRVDRHDEALSLIRGELLAGMQMEWVEEPRRRAHAAHADLLARLAALAAARGDEAEVAELARRQIDLDPLDETASLTLMQAYATSGRLRLAVEEAERLRRAHDRAGEHYEPSLPVRRAIAQLRDTAPLQPLSHALRGYRWDGHLCKPGAGDPHPDFGLLYARIAFGASALPAWIHVGCDAHDGWGARVPSDGAVLAVRSPVDPTLDPSDERVFAVEELLVDGEPLAAADRPGTAPGVDRTFAVPARADGSVRHVDLLVRSRVYLGADARVPVSAVLPEQVTDAEFRLTVAPDIRARRLSVGTSQIAPFGTAGHAQCGKLFGPAGGAKGAFARFVFPLRDGSGVQFEIEREPTAALEHAKARAPRTRPVGRTRRRA
jgi:DNA-binding SARP family transcriptional activator